MPAVPGRRAYDHRLRDLVCEGRDPGLFHHIGVPRSTAASWLRRGPRPVISAEVLARDQQELQAEVLALQRRVRFLLAVIRLAFLLVRLSGFCLDFQRVPDGNAKRSILAALAHAQKAIPLAVALRVLRLSPSRYHAWNNLAQDCPRDDRSSCPRTTPSQLTGREICEMRDMVVSPDYRHMTIRGLALHAQRIGKVFAAAATWARVARERGWLRPRRRLYPPKPKQGKRARSPNEYWHIDVTVIRLLDGTRTYLHAVIDNLSRRILAWKLVLRLEPETTCQVLVEAAKNLPSGSEPATVVADSGVENVKRRGRRSTRLGTVAPRSRTGRGHFLKFHDRSLVALAQASLALPAPARKLRHAGEVDRVLRRAAQFRGSAFGFRGPDPGRDVLRTRRTDPRQPCRRAYSCARGAHESQPQPELHGLPVTFERARGPPDSFAISDLLQLQREKFQMF